MATSFSRDIWNGGFYELAMLFPNPSLEALERALKGLWASPTLQGCYLRPEVDPDQQARIDPAWKTLDDNGHLYGIATLPGGNKVACGVFRVREDSGCTWLGFYLPLGALAEAFDVGAYPFADEERARQWREQLDDWLAQLGRLTFASNPFLLGLVGFEVSGTVSALDLAASGVPEERWIGYLYPVDNQLTWYPTNQWQHKHLLAS